SWSGTPSSTRSGTTLDWTTTGCPSWRRGRTSGATAGSQVRPTGRRDVPVTRYPVAVRQRALLTFVALNAIAAGLHAQRFLFAGDGLPSGLGLEFAALALLAQVGLAALALHVVVGAIALVDSTALVTRC